MPERTSAMMDRWILEVPAPRRRAGIAGQPHVLEVHVTGGSAGCLIVAPGGARPAT